MVFLYQFNPPLPPFFTHHQEFLQYLRLLRMLRLLRLLKVLKIFNVLRNLFRVRPNVVRLYKLVFTVCMISHLGACAWWYIKLRQPAEDLAAFKTKNNIDTDG